MNDSLWRGSAGRTVVLTTIFGLVASLGASMNTAQPSDKGPVTREQAMEIARAAVAKAGTSAEIVLLEDQTREREFGWLFRFAPKKYVETRDPGHLIPGLGPVAVERETGVATLLSGSMPNDGAVAEFERRWRGRHGSGFALRFVATRGTARSGAAAEADGVETWRDLAQTAPLGETFLDDSDVQRYFPDPLRLVLTREASDRLIEKRKVLHSRFEDRVFVATLGAERLFAAQVLFIGSARAIQHPVAYLDHRGDTSALWIRPAHVGRFEGPRVTTSKEGALTAELRDALADHFRRTSRLFDIGAARRAHPGFFAALDTLASAENLLATGDAQAADAKAREGVSQLGNDYAPRETTDDTGLKLAAAQDLRQRGRIQDAAELAIRMLRERIALYRVRHPDTPRDARWLSLRLTFDAHKVRAGEAVNAQVELTNTGDEPLRVNGRLALNSATAPRALREVSFEIKGPREQPRVFLPKVNVGRPRPEDVVELAPGASIKRTWNLAEYFDLSEPGHYWIRVNYESAPVADTQGRAAWSQALTFGSLIVERTP